VGDLNSTLETYVLEAYMPRTSAGCPAAAAARAHRVAAEMRCEGASIRFLSSFFLPEDELWFCLYAARSIHEVAEAGHRTDLALGRIQRAVDVDPSNG